MRQVVVYRDPEDGAWVAEVPSLPGCVTDGTTKAEALENARDAIQAWIAGAESMGLAIPSDSGEVEVVQVG